MAIDVYRNLAHLSRDEFIIYLVEEAYLAPFLASHAAWKRDYFVV